MCLTHVVRVLPTRAPLDLCRSRSQDAANVNNWHWAEIDLMPWAKERLEGLLVGLAAQNVPDKGWVKVTKVEECKGEASVSNRKGKRIVAYEISCKCKWEGQVDYDDVSGELLLPYISEDVDNSEYVIQPTRLLHRLARSSPSTSPCRPSAALDLPRRRPSAPSTSRPSAAPTSRRYEIKLTCKEAGDASHKKAARFLTKELPKLKEGLVAFTKEIYAK